MTSASWMLVNQWRSSFSFPLNTFQTNLRYRARRVDLTPVVVQRLKRMQSILAKLSREPRMHLSQMQDVGGCRAIVRDLTAVYRLRDQYLSDGCKVRNDYIGEPKEDGYRSLHIVGRYQSDWDEHGWNGRRLEIQLRTPLQNAWATALETVVTFRQDPALKVGKGHPTWQRFFALMGAAIAAREGTPMVMNAEPVPAELKALARRLRVIPMFDGWRTALRLAPRRRTVGAESWVLALDPVRRVLNFTPYTSAEAASRRVAELEADMGSRSRMDVVQVSGDSLSELKSAYKNYYADTRQFIEAINVAIGQHPLSTQILP